MSRERRANDQLIESGRWVGLWPYGGASLPLTLTPLHLSSPFALILFTLSFLFGTDVSGSHMCQKAHKGECVCVSVYIYSKWIQLAAPLTSCWHSHLYTRECVHFSSLYGGRPLLFLHVLMMLLCFAFLSLRTRVFARQCVGAAVHSSCDVVQSDSMQ